MPLLCFITFGRWDAFSIEMLDVSNEISQRWRVVFIFKRLTLEGWFFYHFQGMCTFVDHPTRGKLLFAYTRDYRKTSKPQLSSQAIPLSPSSEHTPRRPSNAFVDDLYPVSPQSGSIGLCYLSRLRLLRRLFSAWNFLPNFHIPFLADNILLSARDLTSCSSRIFSFQINNWRSTLFL